MKRIHVVGGGGVAPAPAIAGRHCYSQGLKGKGQMYGELEYARGVLEGHSHSQTRGQSRAGARKSVP